MTVDRDFKRLVRARMQKTGEAYTSARQHLLNKKIDYSKIAPFSDATIQARTGCTWERWVKALDYKQAHTWPHREIVEYIVEKFQVSGWWAQAVTVGYERIKGLRAVGQRRGGLFEASKSKTFAVPLTRLYRACSESRVRSRWLPGVALTVRTATPGKGMRFTWPDQTSVQLWFMRKGTGKSAVAVQHSKLPDRAAMLRAKAFWEERLAALGEVLTA